jgi:hypothetical protein
MKKLIFALPFIILILASCEPDTQVMIGAKNYCQGYDSTWHIKFESENDSFQFDLDSGENTWKTVPHASSLTYTVTEWTDDGALSKEPVEMIFKGNANSFELCGPQTKSINYTFTNNCKPPEGDPPMWHWTFQMVGAATAGGKLQPTVSLDIAPGETVSGTLPPGTYIDHSWPDGHFDETEYGLAPSDTTKPYEVTLNCP